MSLIFLYNRIESLAGLPESDDVQLQSCWGEFLFHAGGTKANSSEGIHNAILNTLKLLLH